VQSLLTYLLYLLIVYKLLHKKWKHIGEKEGIKPPLPPPSDYSL